MFLWVLGSKVQGSRFKGSGVQGSRFKGSGVQGSRFRGSGVQGFWVPFSSLDCIRDAFYEKAE
jgi:hypothetical protein